VNDRRERKTPNYIKEVLKIGKKYNIGYDIIVAGKDQKRKLLLWYHIEVLNNHF